MIRQGLKTVFAVGIAVGMPQPVTAGNWPSYLLNDYPPPKEAPLVRPLVTLRFPIAVSEHQAPLLQQNYANKTGHQGRDLNTVALAEMIPEASQLMFLKTTYHAMQLGRCLSEREPSGFDLILEPAAVERKDGQWAFATSTERPLRTTAVIDFMAFVTPYSLDTSFGNTYQPILNVRVSPAASNETQGLIAANEDFFFISRRRISAGAYEFDARSGLGAALPEFLDLAPLKWGIKWLVMAPPPMRKLPPAIPASRLSGKEWRPGKVVKIPELYYKLELTAAGADNLDTPDMELCQVLGNLLEQVLSTPGVKTADTQRFRDYLSTISAVAGLSSFNIGTEAESTARKLLEAEVRFLVLQDERLRFSFASPDMLESYQRTRAQEAEIARKYNTQGSLAVATMAAGTAAGAAGDGSIMNARAVVAMEMLSQATNEAAIDTLKLKNVYEALTEFSMEIAIEGEAIFASTHEELRQKLGQLFRSKVTAAAER